MAMGSCSRCRENQAAQRCTEQTLLVLLTEPLPTFVSLELAWTSTFDIIAQKGLTTAQVDGIPNIRWSKSTQQHISKLAALGLVCMEKAQAAMEMIAGQKASLLDRMRRETIYRTRACRGFDAVSEDDKDLVLHVTYEETTGRDRAYTSWDFGTAPLEESQELSQTKLFPLMQEVTAASGFLVRCGNGMGPMRSLLCHVFSYPCHVCRRCRIR